MAHHDAVSQDAKIILRVTCTKKSGGVINLTGGSATLRWKVGTAAAVEKAMTIVDAINGVVEYEFQTDELEAPMMRYEVTVTLADATVVTSIHEHRLSVRERLA